MGPGPQSRVWEPLSREVDRTESEAKKKVWIWAYIVHFVELYGSKLQTLQDVVPKNKDFLLFAY